LRLKDWRHPWPPKGPEREGVLRLIGMFEIRSPEINTLGQHRYDALVCRESRLGYTWTAQNGIHRVLWFVGNHDSDVLTGEPTMLAVVSPAKKLDLEPVVRSLPHSQPALLDDAEQLMRSTRRLKPADLQSLMGISENLANLSHERFQRFSTPFTPDNAKPAALMFNGDVFLGLDAPTLGKSDLCWAQDRLAILSGLYGLLRPLDLMQPYRLEMGTRLKNRRGKDLYAFWGDRITDQINERLADHSDRTLVNLASSEYFKAVRPAALDSDVVTPAFKEIRDGRPRMISFLAKRARGLMARYIIENRIEQPENMKTFDAEGYRYDPALSTETTWTFTRAQA